MRSVEEIIRELPENIRGPIYEALIAFRDDIILKETRDIKFEIGKVWEAINDFTKRLNDLTERVNDLTKRVSELAEAQKRTDQKVEELAEAQKKTEQRVYELVGVLQKLTEEHRKTREKLEGPSDSFGYLLEDRAMKSLPKILKENYNINVVEKLKRDYFIVDGEYVEVNILGRAKKEDKEYILLGEAKSRVSKKSVDAFVRKCEKISKRFSKEPIKVLVSYIFSPDIKEYAEEKGIILVPSYELEL